MLKVENLIFKKGKTKILKDVNLEIKRGEIHALLGLNGTGKTTLAYALMGCSGYQPSGGRILFERNEITRLSIWQRAKLGITLAWQGPARFEGLTVREYLKCSNKDADVDNILSIVGFSPDYSERMVDDELSGGERKRIELASVIAMHPKLAILDEIDSGIDIVSMPSIRKTIRKMKKGGITVLLITHNEYILDVADKISLICAGEIVKTAKPQVAKEYFKKHCKGCTHLYRVNWEELKNGFKGV